MPLFVLSRLALFPLVLLPPPSNTVRIGAVFRERRDEHLRQAFQYAVTYLRDKSVFSHHPDINYIEKILPSNSSALLTDIYCSMVSEGIDGVITGSELGLTTQIQLLSDQLDIPLFTILPGGLDRMEVTHKGLTVELFPERELVDAVIDLIKFWEWGSITIVYKDDEGTFRLGEILSDRRLDEVIVSVIKVYGDDYLSAAKQMRRAEECDPSTIASFKACGDTLPRIILDLHSSHVHPFLLAALQVGAIDSNHWYLLTSLDMSEMNLEMFRHNHARIIGFDILDRKSSLDHQRFLAHLRHNWVSTHPSHSVPHFFPMTESLMIFDSVYTLMRGFQQTQAAPLSTISPSSHGDCGLKSSAGGAVPKPHPNGVTLYNYVNSFSTDGLTGRLLFNAGERYNVTLNIHQLNYDGFVNKEGNDTESVTLNRSVAESLWNRHINMSRRIKPHFRVTTIAALPYVKARKSEDEGEFFEGFCIDLLEKLSNDLGFTYAIHEVADGKYGNIMADGNWNGMIGEILNDEADMAVAPLTVNYKRSSVVDFTKPFLSLGISILFRIPGPQKPSLFSFMNPLAADIWIYLGVAIVVVTLAMFAIGRISPYEWNPERKLCEGAGHRGPVTAEAQYAGRYAHPHCPAPPPPPPVQLHNNYSFSGTIWYVASTLMKGGCDFGPKAVSTRLLGGIWWVFTLVIVSAYTANLAAVLTVDRRFIPIKSLEDLANQSVISYGALGGGSTSQFFRESRIETHMKIWKTMNETKKDIFVSSNEEGVNKTKSENYAYLMESTSLEFAVQQSCSLTQIGGVLGSRGYGIALRKQSEWTDRISRQILDYGERGIIELMKTTWWKSKYGAVCGGGGSGSGMKSDRVSLDMENVAGLFVLLLAGILLAIFSVIIEFCIKSRHNANIDKQPLCAEMGQELCFAVRLNNSKKKHTMGRRCSECDGATASPSVLDISHRPLPSSVSVGKSSVCGGTAATHRARNGRHSQPGGSSTHSIARSVLD